MRVCYLLLEEILEGLASVILGRGRSRGDAISLLGVGRWCSVLLDRSAKLIERAVILRVLRSDAVRDGLRALELSAAIEEAALLATVQFKRAFWTLAFR